LCGIAALPEQGAAMKAVNMATQIVIDMFMKRAAEVPFDRHPYHGLLKARSMVDESATEWTDDYHEQALNALCAWTASMIADSSSATMNEVVALMRIANAGDADAKKAANDMAGSMNFLEKVMTSFLNSVDIEHVAEVLFEDGQGRHAAEQEKAKTPTKPEATKPEPKQIQNWTPTRWNPSMN
jgi:hypothetical protein